MKRSFFQVAVTSILLYGCTTWTLTKRLEKKLDGNYTRMLRAILNKSWRQHPTRHQLYGHLPPITKTIQVRRTRHAGHCWRSRDELIRDVLLWTPTHGRAKAGRPARTYIQQLCEDMGCCPEDLPRAKNDREEWRERVRDIRDMMMMMTKTRSKPVIWNASRKKMYPLTKRLQINDFFKNSNYIRFQENLLFFFLVSISVISHYHINELHLFWDCFERFLSSNKWCRKIFFPLLSKVLWSRINSWYRKLFSNLIQKKNTKLLVVEFLAVTWVWYLSLPLTRKDMTQGQWPEGRLSVTWVPCILRHPIRKTERVSFLFLQCILHINKVENWIQIFEVFSRYCRILFIHWNPKCMYPYNLMFRF